MDLDGWRSVGSKNEKVVAIIQARMGSTRLPGKVLMEVMGRPLISYQLERLKFCRNIGEIIVATTTARQDDAIVNCVRNEGFAFFRGAEQDVLDRYYQAALQYNAKHVMRLTGDCPLIDPDVCDWVVDKYFDANADYAATGRNFAEGLDCGVMNFEALEAAWKDARLKSEREHVTLYLRNQPQRFKNILLENNTNDSKYRLTVDEKEDFYVVKAILENLYQGAHHCFGMNEIRDFFDHHQSVYEMNAHIIRNEGLIKSLSEDGAA